METIELSPGEKTALERGLLRMIQEDLVEAGKLICKAREVSLNDYSYLVLGRYPTITAIFLHIRLVGYSDSGRSTASPALYDVDIVGQLTDRSFYSVLKGDPGRPIVFADGQFTYVEAGEQQVVAL